MRSEDTIALVPGLVTWLDGPLSTPTQVGARGYRFGPFTQPGAFAVDPYVLVLYVSGKSEVRRFSGETVEADELGPGDISLHPAAVTARWSWAQPLEILKVCFDPAYLREIAHEVVGGPSVLQMRHGLRVRDDVLAQLGTDLITELTPPRLLASARAARALGERMAIHLLREHFDIKRSGSRERSFNVEEMEVLRAWVNAHLSEEIHVERFARVLHLGVHHFARTFRRSFGRSPHDFVREQRLTRASELLLSSDAPVSAIAMATGFSDQSHLTRCFKLRFGEPPATLRRHRLNN